MPDSPDKENTKDVSSQASAHPIPGGVDTHGIPFHEAFWVWVKIAIYSFGGPAGQIAVMYRLLVEEKKWISENRSLHALNYCMLLPGPEAQQLATYVGWLLHKVKGGLVAGLLFVLPGFVSILIWDPSDWTGELPPSSDRVTLEEKEDACGVFLRVALLSNNTMTSSCLQHTSDSTCMQIPVHLA